jgi:hypothetical protein
MVTSGLDDACLSDTHIFDGTHFSRWKHHMLDHFRAMGPKVWWVVTRSLNFFMDHRNLTKTQKVLFDLDINAYSYLLDALSFELHDKVNIKSSAHMLWKSIKHTFGDSSTWDDGKFEDEAPKVVDHEDDEQDCSTSWSSEDDERSTSSSLDKDDDEASSNASDDATSSTLDGNDDGSCSVEDATTSPSTTSTYCFMSQGDTKVSSSNMIDHIDSYDELVSRLASLTMSLENEKARTLNLEK